MITSLIVASLVTVAWTNDLAVMSLNANGAAVSLKERATGRELLSRKESFVFAQGKQIAYPDRIEPRGKDRWAWILDPKKGGGEVVLSVSSFGPGWTFEVVEAKLPGMNALYLGCLQAACVKYEGRLASMSSDDRSGVCVRSYTADGDMRVRGGSLWVCVPVSRGFVGRRFGIVAGRRGDLIPALRKMTEASGTFHTVNGGAWSLGAEGNRGSYLFADLYAPSTDAWIDFALRSGCETIHLHGWWKSRGHYGFNGLYPRGATDWTNVCARIHAAGLKVGMHTLTAGIQPRDEWVSGAKCEKDFVDWCVHTLAKPFSTNDTEFVVEEMPEDFHHTFHSYSSHGNTFRIGDEAFRYSGIRREKPYAFTGVAPLVPSRKDRKNYPAGTKIHYLFQRYDAFYPNPDSPLIDKVGAVIGEARDLGKVDQIYLDGGEAMCWLDPQIDDLLREKIVRHLSPDMLIEGSNGDAFVWWYLSRYGAWDHALWGVKRMHDAHLEYVESSRVANLLEPQMGWWKPRSGDASARGHFLDEMEYFAAKNAGLDAPMSLDGDNLSHGRPLQDNVMRQVTLHGWYERFRMARTFTPESIAHMATPRAETRLRQDPATGVWMLSSVTCCLHRVSGDASWTVNLPCRSAAAIRVEALYGSVESSATNAQTLLSAADLPQMRMTEPKDGRVKLSLAAGKDAAHGPTLKLTATNRRTSASGACVYADREWKDQPYFSMKGYDGFGVWVKGDGSGALLAFEFGTPQLYHIGRSLHYVTLDFTGWRQFHFLFREREAYEAYAHEWPYGVHPMVVCRTAINVEHISNIRLALNELKPGGTTTVEVASLKGLHSCKKSADGLALEIGGTRTSLPFAMESGEFAELEGGVWSKFSLEGNLLACAPGPQVALADGANAISWRGDIRAEITIQAISGAVPALRPRKDWTVEQRRRMAYEAVMPVRYAPASGISEPLDVPVRPGERARMEIVIWGPAVKPTVAANGKTWTFPVTIGKNEQLSCKDGVHWKLLRRFETVAEGMLENPLPVLDKLTTFTLSAEDPAKTNMRLDAAKRYLD